MVALMTRFARIVSGVAACFAVIPAAGYVASAGWLAGSSAEAQTTAAQNSFLSAWNPPGHGGSTVLERFSLSTGRPLRTLTSLPGRPATVSGPSVASGSVWFSVSSGPRDQNDTASGDPAPNSCSGQVTRFDPTTGVSSTVLSFANSVLVNHAVPSPNGQVLAMITGNCTSSYFNEHLLVEDLSSGKQWTIGATAARCHALFSVAWSPNGSQLVFPFGPASTTNAQTGIPPSDLGVGMCTTPQPSEIAVVPAGHESEITAAELTPPTRGCTYQSAAFDPRGIVAIEACEQGGPPAPGIYLGDAYLVQLNNNRRVVLRQPLKISADVGTVATDPSTGLVLVSESQGQDDYHGYVRHAYDWVWTFNGHELHLVGRYPQGAVTAEPF